MLRMSLRQFERPLRHRALVCMAVAASIASCVGDGGTDEEQVRDRPDETTAGALQAPGGITVAEVTASGSGCPSGSWKANVSDDGSRVSIAFQGFSGTLSSKATKLTKNCAVSVALRGQDDYQYAPSTVSVSGQSAMLATYAASLQWNGSAETKDLTAQTAGKLDRAFFANDLWSPCGSQQTLLVSNEIKAEGRSGDLALLTEVLSFKSRRCPGVAPSEPTQPAQPDGDGGPAKSDDTQPVTILGATTTGSGCPAGTSKAVITPGGKAVSISLNGPSNMSAAACAVVLQIEPLPGQSYALAGYTATAQVDLAEGVIGRLLTNVSYTGGGVDLSKEKVHDVTGPRSGLIPIAQELTTEQLRFSPCDGTNPSLRLNLRPTIANGAKGSFQLTQIDTLKFVVRKCE